LTRALGRPAARNEVSTGRAEDVAVVQALELLNGQEFHDRVYNAQILKETPSVERLYWAVFSRPPAPEELKAGEEFVKNNPGAEGLGDMLWAMFSSPGFAYVQ
jgi:anti-sigma factor RsiW